MKKLLEGLGVVAILYIGGWIGYDWGVHESIKKMRAYGDEHPNETLNDFLCKKIEEDET